MKLLSPSFLCLHRVFGRAVLLVLVVVALAACTPPKKKATPLSDSGAATDVTDEGSGNGSSDTGDTGGGGEVEEEDVPDVEPDSDTTLPPTCEQQIALLPSTDCGCGGQLVCRDQAAEPSCVGALPENACGGCGSFAAEIGSSCGFCGDGVWTCDEANPDVPTCVGETPQNSCGGCSSLPGVEGESCSASGFFLCVGEDDLACVGPGQNACGGFSALGDALGGPCGECDAGRFVCDGTDAVRCEEAAEPRNECGGCGTLPNRVGSDCGDCGGTWQCDSGNPDGLICSQTRNVCGTCGSPGAGTLGASCTGGRLVCGADGQLSCESNDRNLCGGTSELSAEPGAACGACGGFNICASPDRVACIGATPANACGGCGFLPGFPGGFCGVDHTWECNADGTMTCQQTSSSVVVSDAIGGSTQVEQGQVTVPTGAVTEPIRITIRVRNGVTVPGYQLTSPVLEFGPSGTEFAQPLEVQIISDDAPASDMLWSKRPVEGVGYDTVPDAAVDGDALVGNVSHFSTGFTGFPLPDAEICGDGTDNDGDGNVDCDDTDCAAEPGCFVTDTELDCANTVDDDGDLLVDCDDLDCVGDPGCGEPLPEICGDSVDNDGDGMTDCADADCAADPSCGPAEAEVCTDGIDNDGNGRTDCLDPVCEGLGECGVFPDAGTDGGSDTGSDGGGDGACATIVCPVRGQVCGIGPDGPVCYTPCVSDADCGVGQVCTALGCAGGGGSDAGVDGGGDAGSGGSDLCMNPADQSVFGGGTVDAETQTCGLGCLSDVDPAACASSCIEASTGLSPECSGCQGAKIACLITNCLSYCAADPTGVACETCNLTFCQPDYDFCSGAGGPELNCNDGLDNNLNGSADCYDPVCTVDRTCTFGCAELGCPSGQECVSNACIPATRELDCGDGLDDDGDGLADCIDADCGTASVCQLFSGGCYNTADIDLFNTGAYGAAFACWPRSPLQEPLVLGCVLGAASFSDACGACVADYLICTSATSNIPTCISALRTCSGLGFGVGEYCGNGLDDDGDRLVDCADTSCTDALECATGAIPEDCTNGLDEEGDGLVDCADRDCSATAVCDAAVENCSNGIDDNGRGGRDCYEPSCAADPSCIPENCSNGIDDNANGSIDCADAGCAGVAACVESVCDDRSDNDGDGLTDCADDDCAAAPACVESVCDDSSDNDSDGLTDCADDDCVGELFEDVNDGALPSDWTTSSATTTTAGWRVVTTDVIGAAGLRSGVITDGGRSELTIPLVRQGGGSLTFMWKVSSEADYDFLEVLFDGQPSGFAESGEIAWQSATLQIPAGTATLTFLYRKDSSVAGGSDSAWVDEIRIATGAIVCLPETCDNSVDDNANGLVDCEDSDCATAVGCVETACNDYLDDDGDGEADCLDADCAGSALCQEFCDDGIDNDGDGLQDCFDVACRGSAACPVQSCLGVAFTGSASPYDGYSYGYSPTGCGPGEGCSLHVPGEPYTYGTWGGQQLYAGVCAPERTTGQSCGVGTAAGYCGGSDHGADCLGGICQGNEVPSYYAIYGYCGTGETALAALAADGTVYHYCAPVALAAANGEACGDTVGKYCEGDATCLAAGSLTPTRDGGICVATASSPSNCAANTTWRSEWTDTTGRHGLCLPYAATGEACGGATLCNPSAGLVCGTDGTCRPIVIGEGCATAAALTLNTSGIGPDYFAVGRLDDATAADESLNCSGTVGPEKVFFYTAVSPVELNLEIGSVDGNGPAISWHARKTICSEYSAEVACASSSTVPTKGKLQLQAGETAYLVVDSEARFDGGDADAAEFFLALSVTPVAGEGGSCASATCAAGFNCNGAKICQAPTCGDGVVDSGESCEDGNTIDGDGCTACNLDVFIEVEDNDTLATANQIGVARRVSGSSYYEYDYFCADLGPYGGQLTVKTVAVAGNCDIIFNGDWLYCGERTFTFTAPQGCVEVRDGDAGGYMFDVKVEPYEQLAQGAACGLPSLTAAACADIGGAPAVCRENSPRVHTGTCEISTCGDGYADGASGEECDDGNTTASDGCSATCQLEAYNELEPNNGTLTARNIGGYRTVSGTILATTDFDYFKVTLAKRSHLELSVTSTAFTRYNRGLGVQVLNATSAVIFSDSLDPYYGFSGARTGYDPSNQSSFSRSQALAFLEPGTYTLRVSTSGATTGDYVLSIRDIPTSVAPVGASCDPLSYRPCLDGLACSLSTRTCVTPSCGDGNNTAGEGCDDGNTVAGDGCDATCNLETYAFSQLSRDSRNATSLSGVGTSYSHPGGSSTRVIGLTYAGGYARYVSINLTQPTRLRSYNFSGLRVWKSGSGSDLAPAGVQVAAPANYVQMAFPKWLGPALPVPAIDSWDCDGATADGVCTDATGGTDCMDCGARYGVDPGFAYGNDLVLPPGNYTVELTWYDSGRAGWLVVGESPSERRP